jgi:hypothetical protein
VARPLLLSLLVCLLGACAHSTANRLEALRRSADTFHQRARWRDFRGAAELIILERRLAFERARSQGHDDRDLTVTDYQLEDARLTPDSQRAIVVSRLNWVRLPSVTEETALITTEWVWRDGTWFVARQDAGPFVEDLKAPLTELADGGVSG